MNFEVELEQEMDGRWIAEIPEIPGVLAYGVTPLQAGARVRALALRVLADRLENEMSIPGINSIAFKTLCAPPCSCEPLVRCLCEKYLM